MIRFITFMGLLAAIAGAGSLIPAPASANDYVHGHHRHHGHHHGHHGLHRHGFHFGYGIAGILGAFRPHPHRYYAPVYRLRCHPVITTEFRYGRLAEIGGTLCYDRFGRAYIVPGSRYVIRYYR